MSGSHSKAASSCSVEKQEDHIQADIIFRDGDVPVLTVGALHVEQNFSSKDSC